MFSTTLPRSIIALLKEHKISQSEQLLKAGELWQNDNNFVFTNEFGKHLYPNGIERNVKKVFSDMGRPDLRFHDLRYSYATLALQNGDDLKTVRKLEAAGLLSLRDLVGKKSQDLVSIGIKKEYADMIAGYFYTAPWLYIPAIEPPLHGVLAAPSRSESRPPIMEEARESVTIFIGESRMVDYVRLNPTPDEIAELKAWVEQGNDPYSNPTHIGDSCGWEVPFIQGLRAEQDYIETMQAGLIDPPEPAGECDLF